MIIHPIPRLGRSSIGAALVITLLGVALLAVLVVTFFSQARLNRQIAFSSSNMVKTDLMARAAKEIILGEIRQEIVDGSVVPDDANGLLQNGITLYQPLDKSHARPAPLGKDAALTPADLGFSSITKVSAENIAIRPGGTIQGSAVGIDKPGTNGRSIPKSRWFEAKGPRLGSQNILPTWLYLTRGRGVATPSPTEAKSSTSDGYVIGRFAYTVYDVSGRLNANVAGAPTAAVSSMSSLACLDLAKLDPAFTPAVVTKFVDWRNGSDASSATAYQNFLDNFALPQGFMAAKQQQNAFFSRRDLLKAGQDGILPDRPEYFTHTSGSSTDPSWGPEKNSADFPNYQSDVQSVNYLTNSNDKKSENRFIPNVRYPTDSAGLAVTHYRDDGATETYPAKAGESLMHRRFSLNKLKWLGHSGPDATKFAATISDVDRKRAIKDCFGLEWNSAKWRWDYVAGKSRPGPRIKTLAEITEEEREPNFFELLNAGILHGSLGRDPGLGIDASKGPGWSSSLNTGVGVYGSFSYTDLAGVSKNFKAETNLQVFQIGANIIDQYDTDSYPTAIWFDAFDYTFPSITAGVDDISVRTVYGTENLPYLNGMGLVTLADPIPPPGGATGALKHWLQPQIWNPHELPAADLTDYPQGFRAYAYGRIIPKWYINSKPTIVSSPTQYGDTAAATGGLTPSSRGEVYFTNPPNKTSPFYNNPTRLTLDLASTTGSFIVDKVKTSALNYYDPKYAPAPSDVDKLGEPMHYPKNPSEFVGFSTVPDTGYNADPTCVPNPYNPAKLRTKDEIGASIVPDPSRKLYFSLQYLGPDNTYHPYNFLARMTQSNGGGGKYFMSADGVADCMGSTHEGGWGTIRPDPRTDRFSSMSAWWGKGVAQTTNYPGTGGPLTAYGSGAGGAGSFGTPYLPSIFKYVPAYDPTATTPDGSGIRPGTWAINNPSDSFVQSGVPRNSFYADADGVVRYGDAYRQNRASGDGNPQYHGGAAVSPSSNIANSSASSMGGSSFRRRPVILNRPFRSIGELGYVFRDQPFKTLDFWSPTSGDAALLDLFALADGPSVSAEGINPAAAPAAVLKTLFVGAWKNKNLNSKISDTEAQKIADTISKQIGTNPYGNRSDLALLMGPAVSGQGTPVAFDASKTAFDVSKTTVLDATSDRQSAWANKSYTEAPMRAVADVADFRTWNLLIDVVAQSGHLAPNATSMDRFTVQGEKRYWLHVAIDRYTGKVLQQQLEPFYD